MAHHKEPGRVALYLMRDAVCRNEHVCVWLGIHKLCKTQCSSQRSTSTRCGDCCGGTLQRAFQDSAQDWDEGLPLGSRSQTVSVSDSEILDRPYCCM